MARFGSPFFDGQKFAISESLTDDTTSFGNSEKSAAMPTISAHLPRLFKIENYRTQNENIPRYENVLKLHKHLYLLSANTDYDQQILICKIWFSRAYRGFKWVEKVLMQV